MVMSGRSDNLTTLSLDRLRPPKWITSTSCTYFLKYLTTALFESQNAVRTMYREEKRMNIMSDYFILVKMK